MKRTDGTKAIMIVSLCIFVVFALFLMVAIRLHTQTEETTTSYTATVNEIRFNGTGNGINIEIYTEEFNNYLLISEDISKFLDMNDIKELKKGQTVYLTIENYEAEIIEDALFVSINSLKTDAQEIFSLQDYNEYMFKNALPAEIMCTVSALISLIVFIYSFCKYRKAQF